MQHLHRWHTRLRTLHRAKYIEVRSQYISLGLVACCLCMKEFHDMYKTARADLTNTQTLVTSLVTEIYYYYNCFMTICHGLPG